MTRTVTNGEKKDEVNSRYSSNIMKVSTGNINVNDHHVNE